jgi:hypothetical protein
MVRIDWNPDDVDDVNEETEEDHYGRDPFLSADESKHWRVHSVWTVDEATALSFGRNPEVVTQGRLPSLPNVFTIQYLRRLKVLELAFPVETFPIGASPAAFVNWFDEREIDTNFTRVTPATRKSDGGIETVSNETFDAVRKDAEKGDKKSTTFQPPSESQHSRARNAADSIVVALAAKHYGYDGTDDSRKTVAKKIAEFSFSKQDTIEDHLKRGWLDRNETEMARLRQLAAEFSGGQKIIDKKIK